ncbi:hypothetical protein FNV43_RR12305 [Rhamnella rubrinervis]|uniref:Uncharacterized protein n=1 Tax=Rhamnella rubrinervis TaxID=2594499 RepID=A0A8K0MIR4_9ROSA|nr:hypothetical protein FNV43_RR12305 [Rhamnella rubrinervis]
MATLSPDDDKNFKTIVEQLGRLLRGCLGLGLSNYFVWRRKVVSKGCIANTYSSTILVARTLKVWFIAKGFLLVILAIGWVEGEQCEIQKHKRSISE